MTCVLKIDILRGNPFRSLIFSTDVYWNLKLAVSIANMTEATYGHTLVATGADIADMKAVVLGTGSHCEVKKYSIKICLNNLVTIHKAQWLLKKNYFYDQKFQLIYRPLYIAGSWKMILREMDFPKKTRDIFQKFFWFSALSWVLLRDHNQILLESSETLKKLKILALKNGTLITVYFWEGPPKLPGITFFLKTKW